MALVPFTQESLTIDAAAVYSLTSSVYSPVGAPPAVMAIVSGGASGDVRFWFDSTSPTVTTTVGHDINQLSSYPIVVSGLTNIQGFRIRTTSGSNSLQITYYR